MEMSVRALLVSGCVCRYVLMDSDTELWVVAMPLALHSSGAAFALGITIAADAMPPSRPPARTPYRPRRAVIVVFFEFIECLPLICDGFIAAQGLAVRSRAKHSPRAAKHRSVAIGAGHAALIGVRRILA